MAMREMWEFEQFGAWKTIDLPKEIQALFDVLDSKEPTEIRPPFEAEMGEGVAM